MKKRVVSLILVIVMMLSVTTTVNASECSHSNQTTYFAAGNVIPDDNGLNCIYDGYFITLCEDCGTELDIFMDTEKREHDFDNGICNNCFYESAMEDEAEYPECLHTNVEETFTGNTYNTETHFVREGIFQEYCKDCDKVLSEEYEDIKKVAHKFSANTCLNCGYIRQETKLTAWVFNTEGWNLNLRSSANTSSPILAKIPEYASLTIIGTSKINNFYKANYNGTEGYVSCDYITFEKPSLPATDNSYILPFNGNARITVLDYYWGAKKSGAHPTKGSGETKGAIDFAVTGDALASKSGTVVEAKTGYNSGWGNYILVQHSNSYSFYAHLSKIYVSPGQSVSQGQAIGRIGSTGNSTGVHLHFEIHSYNGQVMYAIDLFKEKYKSRLRYDVDIVSGGSNNASIRNWIVSNYTLSNGVYVPKTTSSTTNVSITTTTAQQSSNNTSPKVAWLNACVPAFKEALSAKHTAATAVIDTINSINLRTAVQKFLGVSISALTTYDPMKLYQSFDEDVALALISWAITDTYFRNGCNAETAFLQYCKSGITTDDEARLAFNAYCDAIACFSAATDANIETVKSYTDSKEYTQRMLDTFFLSVLDGFVIDGDVKSLKKAADSTLNASSLVNTVYEHSIALKTYNSKKAELSNLWDKVN